MAPVRIVRQDMRERWLTIPGQQMLGQCQRVATALVLVTTDHDLPEHLDASRPSR